MKPKRSLASRFFAFSGGLVLDDLRVDDLRPALEFGQLFRQRPERPIQVRVLVDAFDLTRRNSAHSLAAFIPLDRCQAPFENVFLGDVERAPQVFANVLSATWD